MCLFCDTRLNTIRELRKEIRDNERLIKQHDSENSKCTLCKTSKLKAPERRFYHRDYYQANREKKIAASLARYHAKKNGADQDERRANPQVESVSAAN